MIDLKNHVVFKVKRCVEPKAMGPASHTSFHHCVIYINHMVSKVITIYGQSCGFSGSAICFEVNHGLKSTQFYSPVMPRPHSPIRSPVLYPEFTQTFDCKCYKLFTSNATNFDASFHELAIAALCCFYCYTMRDDSSPLLH